MRETPTVVEARGDDDLRACAHHVSRVACAACVLRAAGVGAGNEGSGCGVSVCVVCLGWHTTRCTGWWVQGARRCSCMHGRAHHAFSRRTAQTQGFPPGHSPRSIQSRTRRTPETWRPTHGRGGGRMRGGEQAGISTGRPARGPRPPPFAASQRDTSASALRACAEDTGRGGLLRMSAGVGRAQPDLARTLGGRRLLAGQPRARPPCPAGTSLASARARVRAHAAGGCGKYYGVPEKDAERRQQ